jgi:ribulose-bisphosphate carboxylase large chain
MRERETKRALSNSIRLTYVITTEQNPEKIAHEIALEQTVELPADLIPHPSILEKIVGRVLNIQPESRNRYRVILEYSADIFADSFSRFLNMIFGNISFKRGIRLVEVTLPSDISQTFSGPAFGIEGLRAKAGILNRPLTCAALKPLGLSASELARICYEFSLGGIDIIKDDHNLGDHSFCTCQDRFRLCREAVLRAQEKTGKRTLYFAHVNGRVEAVRQQIDYAFTLEIDGLLVQPTVMGLDFFYSITRDKDLPFLLMAHPSLSGAFLGGCKEGISPGTWLGTLFRLAGADAVIFPSYSGRFSFNKATCREITHNLLAPLPGIAPSFPTPAGGMDISALPQILKFYPKDTIFLIGADLYRRGRNLQEKARQFSDILKGSFF